jgi:hypothetical protein
MRITHILKALSVFLEISTYFHFVSSFLVHETNVNALRIPTVGIPLCYIKTYFSVSIGFLICTTMFYCYYM